MAWISHGSIHVWQLNLAQRWWTSAICRAAAFYCHWRRLHRARRACAPNCYKWLGMWGTMSRRTANRKLAKLYWPSWKRSTKRLIVLVELKKVEGHDKSFFLALCSGHVPPPLLTSFWCPWLLPVIGIWVTFLLKLKENKWCQSSSVSLSVKHH